MVLYLGVLMIVLDTTIVNAALPSIRTGLAFSETAPLLLAAMSDVGPADSGLASGVVDTAFMMGGALLRTRMRPAPGGQAAPVAQPGA